MKTEKLYSESFYLGIDGGGTKTEFVLCDSSGKIIKKYLSDGCNPNDVGIDICLEIIKNGCNEVCSDIEFRNVSVFAGIAGVSSGNYCEIIKNYFKSLGFYKADCSSDTKLAVAATLGEKDGITVIMGTGIVVIIQKAGQLKTIGGYNYFFDKGGSAFNIGHDAISYALLCEERNMTATPLYESVKAKCGTDSVYSNLKKIYTEGKQYIAQFACCVTETYYTDIQSQKITDYNMQCVADMINYAMTYFDNIDCVYFTGGLTSKSEILINHLSDYINKKCRLSFYNGSLIKGSLNLAGLEVELC